MSSPLRWTAAEIAARVAAGDVSAEEVTRTYVARIEAVGFCGIAGLKPTARWIPLEGTGEVLPWLLAIPDTVGPLARTVADLELGLSALATPAPREGTSLSGSPVTPRPSAAVVPSGLRVGYYQQDGHFPVSPAIRRAVRESAEALRAEGVQVVPFAPPRIAEIMEVASALFVSDQGETFARLLVGSPVDPRNVAFARLSRVPLGAAPAATRVLRWLGQRRYASLLEVPVPRTPAELTRLMERSVALRKGYLQAVEAERLDAILGHGYPLPPLRHGASAALTPIQSGTMVFNLLGWPAGVVSVTSVGATEESDLPESVDRVDRVARETERGSGGLPIAVQVAARPWREDVVLALLAVLERRFAGAIGEPSAVAAAARAASA